MAAKNIKVGSMTLGMVGTNCFFVFDDGAVDSEGKKHGVLFDPADRGDRIYETLTAKNFVIDLILLTHGHFDHIGAVRELMDADTKLIIHSLDAPMLTDPELNAGKGLLGWSITAPEATDQVKEGDELELAGLKVKVLHTPGHTPGSVCYEIEGELFTGDTVFEYGWGRTDLPGGSEEQMAASLRRLAPMVRTMPMHAGH